MLIYFGIGSNIGERDANLRNAIELLQEWGNVSLVLPFIGVRLKDLCQRMSLRIWSSYAKQAIR